MLLICWTYICLILGLKKKRTLPLKQYLVLITKQLNFKEIINYLQDVYGIKDISTLIKGY